MTHKRHTLANVALPGQSVPAFFASVFKGVVTIAIFNKETDQHVTVDMRLQDWHNMLQQSDAKVSDEVRGEYRNFELAELQARARGEKPAESKDERAA